jgi:uncharacterized Zn-binding protein involved in type VI secretion
MPAAARGFLADNVFSRTGFGRGCRSPMVPLPKTFSGSPSVFINGVGAVRAGDFPTAHPITGCFPDPSVLAPGSATVFINGFPAGRIGDLYTADNIIISGSTNVFIGG